MYSAIFKQILTFSSDLVTLGLEGTVPVGVKPHSGANAGAYSARSTLLNGVNPQITSSSGKVFDFDSFYFGCVAATAETILSVPQPCTISVVGYKAGTEVARQRYEFKIGDLELQTPTFKVILPKEFKGLDTATFTTESDESLLSALGGVGDAITATLLDDFSYSVYDAAKDAKKQQ